MDTDPPSHSAPPDELSALLEYREQIESMIQTAGEGIVTIDSKGRIEVFNPAAERMFGYSREEVVGKNVTVLMPEEIANEHDGYIRRYQETGEAKIIGMGREVTGRRKDGSTFPLELNVGPYDDGHFTGFLRDVSARKRLEAEYLQAQKMEAVGRLAGGVAHDFNNLLAGIQSGLSLAMEKLDANHPSFPLLREVLEEAERGTAITRRLLDFSRTDRAAPQPVDPAAALRNSEKMIRRLLGEDIDVRIEADSEGALIVADSQMVEQVLLNLAINARDAMPHGGVLALACGRRELTRDDLGRLGGESEPGRYVLMTVEDEGCGMNDETLARAKEAFFTTKKAGLGTGLGLSTVDTIVRGWGGVLAIESEVGRGTTVSIYVPETDSSAPTAEAALDDATAEATVRGGRILVVEDEKLVRLGIEHQLRGEGYEVSTAKDAPEALAMLGSIDGKVDLLLTDVVLPGMGGPELVEKARELHPALCTLFMSAFPQQELVARGRIQAGTLALEKPFQPEELYAKVRASLSGAPKPG